MSDPVVVAPFDPNTMTVQEAIDFESMSGMAVEDLFVLIERGTNPPFKAAAAIICLTLQREDPSVTFEDVCGMQLAGIEWGKDANPPTGADSNGNGSAPSAPSSVGAPPPPSAP